MTKKSKSKTLAKTANIPSIKSKLARPLSCVKVRGEGIDEFGDRFIKFAVVGSDHDIPPFSVKQLTFDPKPLFSELANAGWNGFMPKARRGLLEKLQIESRMQRNSKLSRSSAGIVEPMSFQMKSLECPRIDLNGRSVISTPQCSKSTGSGAN